MKEKKERTEQNRRNVLVIEEIESQNKSTRLVPLPDGKLLVGIVETSALYVK